MKKKIGMVVVFAFLTASAFALSVGGGLLFDYSANNGLETNIAGNDLYTGIRNTSFGGFVFFDATYVEADISFAYGSLTLVTEMPGISSTDDFGSVLQLGFSILGKYPFHLGSVTLFPLLGFNLNAVVSGSDNEGNKFTDAGDLSQFSLQAGIGLDYHFTDSIFLRAEGLFQLRFASKYQDDMMTFLNKGGGGWDTTFGMGPVIKVAVGYKF